MRDFVVKILVRLGIYKPIVELINRAKFEVQARRMRRDGLNMLSAADKVFTEMGARVFLTYGALLGAYREHGFIPYDPDLDLGILESEIPADLHSQMSKAGFRLLRQNYIGSTGQICEETYEYKKIHLDIFFYFRDGNDLYSVIQYPHESKEWKKANVTDGFPCKRSYVPFCEFERRDFLGLQIFMPKDTDGWLRAIYSDSYMTPIKNWSSKYYKTRITPINDRSYRRYF